MAKKTTKRTSQDKAVKEFIENLVKPQLEDHKTFEKQVDGWISRFEAVRSIKGLTYGENPERHPKYEPWDGCSDIGVPLEAITLRAIIARFVKTIFTKPICNVGGRGGQDVKDAKVVQEYQTYSLEEEMEYERHFYDVMMDVGLAGDGYGKLIEADEEYEWEETYFTLINPYSGEPVIDPNTKNEFDENYPDGYPVEVNEDYQPKAIQNPENPVESATPEVQEITVEKTDKTFFGTKLIPIDPKDFVVPDGADTWDLDELSWIGHKFKKNWYWLKDREGDPSEGGYENVDKIKPETNEKDTQSGGKNITKKVDLIEVWGKVDMPSTNGKKGEKKPREIVALYAIEKGELLGWIFNPYKGKRMIFHWQIMPMAHRQRGISIPKFAKGIRDLVDSEFNNVIDRNTINAHPPFMYDEASGFDPEIHQFGPHEFWGVSDQTKLGRLDMGATGEYNSKWIIEFTLGLLQKLFGVTDYTLGMESNIASNKTARGIMAIIGEGNFSFDTMIALLQMTNKRFFSANIQMHAKMMKEKKMEKKVFYITESQDNPMREISLETMSLKWNFIPRGTSLETNIYRKRENATAAHKILGGEIFFSPDVSPTTLNNRKLLVEKVVEGFEMKDIKLPDAETLAKEQLQMKVKVEKEIRKEQEMEQLKKVAKHDKGPKGRAAKKVIADIETGSPDTQIETQKGGQGAPLGRAGEKRNV